MKYTFRPNETGNHIRTEDNVRGDLREHSDTVNTWGAFLVDPSDFTKLPVAPAPVPARIANWRAKAILEISGLLTAVESSIAAMDGTAGIVARAAWESGAELERHGATVTALAAQLGLSAEQVDSMFVDAAALSV